MATKKITRQFTRVTNTVWYDKKLQNSQFYPYVNPFKNYKTLKVDRCDVVEVVTTTCCLLKPYIEEWII